MQKGDILLVHDTDIAARFIQYGTKGYWNHCAFITSNDGEIVEAVSSGVRRNNIEHYAHLETKIISFGISEEDAQHAIDWLDGQVGKRYNFLDIANIFFVIVLHSPINISFDNGWICSALCAEAFEHSGLILPKDPARTWPNDLDTWAKEGLRSLVKR